MGFLNMYKIFSVTVSIYVFYLANIRTGSAEFGDRKQKNYELKVNLKLYCKHIGRELIQELKIQQYHKYTHSATGRQHPTPAIPLEKFYVLEKQCKKKCSPAK